MTGHCLGAALEQVIFEIRLYLKNVWPCLLKEATLIYKFAFLSLAVKGGESARPDDLVAQFSPCSTIFLFLISNK